MKAALGILAMVVVLAGCGDSQDGGATDEGSPPPTQVEQMEDTLLDSRERLEAEQLAPYQVDVEVNDIQCSPLDDDFFYCSVNTSPQVQSLALLTLRMGSQVAVQVYGNAPRYTCEESYAGPGAVDACRSLVEGSPTFVLD